MKRKYLLYLHCILSFLKIQAAQQLNNKILCLCRLYMQQHRLNKIDINNYYKIHKINVRK